MEEKFKKLTDGDVVEDTIALAMKVAGNNIALAVKVGASNLGEKKKLKNLTEELGGYKEELLRRLELRWFTVMLKKKKSSTWGGPQFFKLHIAFSTKDTADVTPCQDKKGTPLEEGGHNELPWPELFQNFEPVF